MPTRLFALLTTAVLALAILPPPFARAQNASQQLAAASVLESIKKRGAIRVGMSTFVPWAMRDKNGEMIGYEIDVAKQLAEDMKVKAEFVPTAWDGIIPALLAGKFDVVIGGMTITPERNLTVNFTQPYANSGIHMVANKELAAGFKSLADFNKPDVVLAVRRGATPATATKRLMPKATLRQFDEDALALQEVLNGKAHAFKQFFSHKLVDFIIFGQQYALVFNPSHRHARQVLLGLAGIWQQPFALYGFLYGLQ